MLPCRGWGQGAGQTHSAPGPLPLLRPHWGRCPGAPSQKTRTPSWGHSSCLGPPWAVGTQWELIGGYCHHPVFLEVCFPLAFHPSCPLAGSPCTFGSSCWGHTPFRCSDSLSVSWGSGACPAPSVGRSFHGLSHFNSCQLQLTFSLAWTLRARGLFKVHHTHSFNLSSSHHGSDSSPAP